MSRCHIKVRRITKYYIDCLRYINCTTVLGEFDVVSFFSSHFQESELHRLVWIFVFRVDFVGLLWSYGVNFFIIALCTDWAPHHGCQTCNQPKIFVNSWTNCQRTQARRTMTILFHFQHPYTPAWRTSTRANPTKEEKKRQQQSHKTRNTEKFVK